MGKNQHVTKHPGGGWQVKGAGNGKETVVTNTQSRQSMLLFRLQKATNRK